MFDLLTIIDEIGRDELNRTSINEDQRLRQTMNLNGCAAVQCTSRVSSDNAGTDPVNCAMQSPSATEMGSENPRAEIVDLLFSIPFARASWSFQRPRARTSTAKFSGFCLADRAVGHQICHTQLTIQLRKLVLVFVFQAHRWEQVQNSEDIPNLHPPIFEELRGYAVRDLVNLHWVDNARRAEGRQVEFRALRERAAFAGQGAGLTDGNLVDLRELLEMNLELLIEKGSLAGAFCEEVPPPPVRSPSARTGRWPSWACRS